MRRNKLGIMIAAGVFAVAAQTKATTITDTFADADKYNMTGLIGGGQSIAGGGGSFSGNFNLETDDGTPTFTVSGSIYKAAIGGAGDVYNSTLGFDPKKEQVTDGVAKFWFHDTAHNQFTVDLELDSESGNSGGKIVVLEESIGLSVIAQLNIDGKVDYRVTNNGTKPIKLDYAYLGVNVESIPATPDGGTTATLLGFGLLGIAGLRRKLS